jgi:guanyl-specific ribonuclease Sa
VYHTSGLIFKQGETGMNKKRIVPLLLLIVLLAIVLWLGGANKNGTNSLPTRAPAAYTQTDAPLINDTEQGIKEDGLYTTKKDVSDYLAQYGRLPQNFITKREAQTLGWPGGDLRPYAKDRCIGGDRFGNYEGLLPEKSGRTYYECDIDTLGAASRGPKRIVYSNDGLIYYTPDHYESFELLEGTP